jgi:hypothetical protein
VLVANPEDKVIYYYREGMAAPMGHFQNYSRRPRAVLVVDRSLRETQPGVYETVASLGPAGEYQLALFLDTPRVVHCFSFAVAEDPVLAAQRKLPVTVEIETEKKVVTVGEEVAVRLRLSDPAGSVPMTGLRDVRVLTFLSPGTWQERHWAAELGNGRYEVRFKPPEAGVYFIFVLIDSVNLPYQKSPFLVLTAEAPGNPGNAAGGPS